MYAVYLGNLWDIKWNVNIYAKLPPPPLKSAKTPLPFFSQPFIFYYSDNLGISNKFWWRIANHEHFFCKLDVKLKAGGWPNVNNTCATQHMRSVEVLVWFPACARKIAGPMWSDVSSRNFRHWQLNLAQGPCCTFSKSG